MRHEGVLCGALFHREQYKDEVRYAILREDYDADRAGITGGKTKETAED